MDANEAVRPRSEWEAAPMVFVASPRCPHCGSECRKTIRSVANGDGSQTRRTVCLSCHRRYLLVIEPPEFGRNGGCEQ